MATTYLRLDLASDANPNLTLPTESSATDASTLGDNEIVLAIADTVTFDALLQRLHLLEAQIRDNLRRTGNVGDTPTVPS